MVCKQKRKIEFGVLKVDFFSTDQGWNPKTNCKSVLQFVNHCTDHFLLCAWRTLKFEMYRLKIKLEMKSNYYRQKKVIIDETGTPPQT